MTNRLNQAMTANMNNKIQSNSKIKTDDDLPPLKNISANLEKVRRIYSRSNVRLV